MKTAIKEGVKEGVDAARMSTMMRELVDKIGADPGALLARVEALEAARIEHEARIASLETWHPNPRP